MITSIFKKSKALNLLIVFFITLLAFVKVRITDYADIEISGLYIFKQIGLFLLCYATIALLNFIVRKNSLGKDTKYAMLLFSLFLLMLPETTNNTNILFSNVFILLALRRLLSLRSQLNVNKKLFDATFWIAIATLFYFWAILFLPLIILLLLLYDDNKINHWIIPFMGLATVFVITTSISLLCYGTFLGAFKSLPHVSFNYSNYNSATHWIAITIILSFGIWSSVFYVKSIKQKKKIFRKSFSSIFVAVLLSFIIIVLAPQKNSSEFLFMFAPLSIIIANYIEVIQEKWFKELFLLLLIAAPFVILML